MSNEIFSYETNAWLAVAAYAKTDGQKIVGEKPLEKTIGFTKSQLEEFNDRFRVDYYYSDNITGIGATLFWDRQTQRHILAIRGTEETSFKDILNDVFLTATGVAYEQEVALEAFYRRISTPASEGGLGLLAPGEKIDVTGHSLGGFLAQVFTSKHEDTVNHTYPPHQDLRLECVGGRLENKMHRRAA